VTIPAGYRDWKLIAVANLATDKIDQLRAQLGNEKAIKAFEEGKIPFPDGTIIAALHWNRVRSEDNDKVLAGPFPGAQSFVVGSAANVQFMVKDSKRYAATGGWGFADFKDGKPGNEASHETASPATSLPKLTTMFSLITHLRPERSTLHELLQRSSRAVAAVRESGRGPLASMRGNAALRLFSEQSGHLTEPR